MEDGEKKQLKQVAMEKCRVDVQCLHTGPTLINQKLWFKTIYQTDLIKTIIQTAFTNLSVVLNIGTLEWLILSCLAKYLCSSFVNFTARGNKVQAL